MINQIEDKLKEIKAANEANDTKKYNDLLTLFYNSFAFNYTFRSMVKPPNCNGDILSFMNDVKSHTPTWVNPDHIQKYITTLQNKEVVAIIGEVQKKINERGLFKGGGHSFKKRTTSTRKSIKRSRSRSRSNRRRHRRTARK